MARTSNNNNTVAQAQAQAKKSVKASLSIARIDTNFIAGINRTLHNVYSLSVAENKVKTLTDKFKADRGYSKGDTMSEIDKQAMRDDTVIKNARKEVKDCKDKAQGTADLLLARYTDIDFTQDDSTALLSTSTLESILKNTGALQGGKISDCKDKAQAQAIDMYTTVRSYLSMVLNRRTQAMARRSKGDYKLTYKDSKDIQNNSLDYILALADGLTSTGIFTYVGDKDRTIKCVYDTDSTQAQA